MLDIVAESKFLAFDFGAESGRAVLGTLRGGRLALAELHRFANPHEIKQGRLLPEVAAQCDMGGAPAASAAGGSILLPGC
ncbi:MAG: hypothetical protein ABR964_08485 [Tepidisphaeraceae bacterium]|jgi:hypothetical protein